MKSYNKPTAQIVDAIVPRLSSSQHERHFFQGLENPHWIEPLYSKGFFKQPPESLGWAQSEYLARMATHLPELVARIFRNLKTKNPNVIRDLVSAANAMPPQYAVTLAGLIGSCAAEPGLWFSLEGVALLITKLAKNGFAKESVNLAKSVYRVRSTNEAGSKWSRADFLYFETLQNSVIPALASVSPKSLLEALLTWTLSAIESKRGSHTSSDELSPLWRPAIEEHGQNNDREFASLFVDTLRIAFETVIRERHLPLVESLETLAAYGGVLFERLRIHLICEFADCDPALARRTILDHTLFKDARMKHEYARLVGMRFNLLSEAQKVEWLTWVDKGPGDEYSSFNDDLPDDDARKSKLEYWQFQKLHWIREHLEGERRDFHQRMIGSFGWPHLADLHLYTSPVTWSDTSPAPADELARMGFDAALKLAKTWQPDVTKSRFQQSSRRGLANSFQAFVTNDPVAYSQKARQLIDSPAIIVRAFLDVMNEACKANKLIALDPVLDLCEWVASQSLEEIIRPDDEDDVLVDKRWNWCWSSVAELLEHICDAVTEDKKPVFAIDFRNRIWSLIERVSTGPGDTNVLRNEKDVDPRLVNWLLLAMNSLRGRAINAAMSYVQWVSHGLGFPLDGADHKPIGFDKMPEVREFLERQIVRKDEIGTGRAVLGWRIWQLWRADPVWLQDNAEKIFDISSADSLGRAAWNAYLSANSVNAEYYRILKQQYRAAVDESSSIAGIGDFDRSPYAHVAEHLMILFGRGHFGDEGAAAYEYDDGIIRRLITQSLPEIRMHAMQFVGGSLERETGAIEAKVIDRFRFLWEKYWENVGKTDAQNNPSNRNFGYWFASGRFDATWSLTYLEELVRLAPLAEPDDQIMEHLVTICEIDPAASTRIVGILVDGDKENWRIYSWKEHAKRILEIGLKAGGATSKDAMAIINRLGRRGYLEFGELLKSESN